MTTHPFAQILMLEDPRMNRTKIYPIDFLLLSVFLATMSGMTSWYEIEDYGFDNQEDIKRAYQALTGKTPPERMPSHDTLNRSIGMLSIEGFMDRYKAFIEELIGKSSGKQICIDGKTMRGLKKLKFDSDAHTVSAYSPNDMATIAQVYTNEKTGEYNAIKDLLNTLELEDTVVSIDALGTQTDIAEEIVSKGGHYLLCVKANQKHTREDVESFFCPMFQKYIEIDKQEEVGHGRIETWIYESISAPSVLEDSEILKRWKDLKSIHRVTRIREDKKTGKRSEEVAYYISSSADFARLRVSICHHWAIENQLHRSLDVFFGQDASLKRAGNVAQIMDMIQKVNLFLLNRLKTQQKSSISRAQKRLSRLSPQEILALLF